MMHIDPQYYLGRRFYGFDKATTYVAVGFAMNETLLIIGENYDDKTKESKMKTFKLSEVHWLDDRTKVVPQTTAP